MSTSLSEVDHDDLPRPFILVMDFDGTLTTDDTLQALATHVGYAHKPRKHIPHWSYFTKAYEVDLSWHATHCSHQYEHTFSGAIEYLNSLRNVETSSARRVLDSGMFEGATSSDIENGALTAIRGESVRFRKGVFKLIRTAWSLIPQAGNYGCDDNGIFIVSVNWSRGWITELLGAAGGYDIQQSLAPHVNANELVDKEEAEDSDSEYFSSHDKWRDLQNIRKNLVEPRAEDSIYIGDSPTDIECLCDATFGICIRDEPMKSGQQELADMLGLLCLEICHISAYMKKRSQLTEDAEVVAPMWARDLREVEEWLRCVYGSG